jgi:ribosomal protein S18 acetylase RimI-like enzyme
VNDVVHETYGHLHPEKLSALSDPNQWFQSWVAADRNDVVGVGLPNGNCIDDLWLRSDYRQRKIGSQLLAILESQIRKNGHSSATLRVVAENVSARRFYLRHGWQELKLYPHEKWGVLMVDMQKELNG